jgi:hypothetical protein
MLLGWFLFPSIFCLFFPTSSLSHFIFFSLSSLHLQLIQFSHFLLSNCLPKFTYTKLLLLLRWVYSTGLMILSSGAREGVGRAGEIQIILLGPILRFIQADWARGDDRWRKSQVLDHTGGTMSATGQLFDPRHSLAVPKASSMHSHDLEIKSLLQHCRQNHQLTLFGEQNSFLKHKE